MCLGAFSDVLRFSNYGGRGPERVGASGSIGPFGTHDMAGNVKEWTWNPKRRQDDRFILGGAWNEPPYTFHDEDAKDPMERNIGFGFRCIQESGAVPAELTPRRLKRSSAIPRS